MSEAKHTPGPWHRNIRAGGKYTTVFAGRNQHVASVHQQKDPDEVEANIDLIAAAPDLLAALQDALDNCIWRADCPTPISSEEAQRLYDKARAAIAKAKGVSL